MNINNLIKYIVLYATEQGIKLTQVRLVKFLYLADLYFARRNQGKTFTGLPWAFIYYGPYCGEAMTAIDAAPLQIETYESRYKEGELYSLYSLTVDRPEEIEKEIPTSVIYPLQQAIKRYGDDTAHLLDHVYFETEPMQDAKKGDTLDFSLTKAQPVNPSVKLKKLSKKKITEARAHIQAIKKKRQRDIRKIKANYVSSRKWYDDTYYKAIDVFGDDLDTGLTGNAKIVS